METEKEVLNGFTKSQLLKLDDEELLSVVKDFLGQSPRHENKGYIVKEKYGKGPDKIVYYNDLDAGQKLQLGNGDEVTYVAPENATYLSPELTNIREI